MDGVALCCMFGRAIRGKRLPAVSISPMESQSSNTRGEGDQDGPTRAAIAFRSWSGRLGRFGSEYLDRTLFWTTVDPKAKLTDFQHYYDGHRTHAGRDGGLPELATDGSASPIDLKSYRWRNHCRGLHQTPIAASFYEFAMDRFYERLHKFDRAKQEEAVDWSTAG
jgi:hypothetical protein